MFRIFGVLCGNLPISCKTNRFMLYIEIVGKKQLEVVQKRDEYPPDEPVPETSY